MKVLPPAEWYPQTGPQSLGYTSGADELFFGGSAGGGKSDLLVGLGKTAHINSLILRKEATQLTGFKERIRQLMRDGDKFQGVGPHGGILRTFDGRMMEFSGCDNFIAANTKFRGRPHDLKAWDELPTFPQAVYEFVNAWNRTTVPGQRCRIVGAGNPPATPEEEWVLDYWKSWLRDFTAEPGELRWFVRINGEFIEVADGTPVQHKGKTFTPRSRTFIPATLQDNPILERTGYANTLAALPEPLRSQLLYGDMRIGLVDGIRQLIPTKWIDISMRKWVERRPNPADLSAIAIDPARGGGDRSVMAKRYKNWIPPLLSIPGVQTPDGPTAVSRFLLHIDSVWAPIIIDITGTAGGGLFDSFRLLHPNLPTWAFVAAGKSGYRDRSGRLQIRNKRTEAYWRLRDALDPENPEDEQLLLPPDKELRLELTAQQWYMFSNGAGLEDKDDISRRLGRSPDKADAVAMLMMDEEASVGWVGGTTQKLAEEAAGFMGGEDPSLRLNNSQPFDESDRWVT